jgi:hypothetical protein
MCGLDCSQCEAMIATKTNDDSLRARVAVEWNARYASTNVDRRPLVPTDINCEGCLSRGIIYRHCRTCGARACGIRHTVKNCGECAEYPCRRIEALHQRIPRGKGVCDHIHEHRIEIDTNEL